MERLESKMCQCSFGLLCCASGGALLITLGLFLVLS